MLYEQRLKALGLHSLQRRRGDLIETYDSQLAKKRLIQINYSRKQQLLN